MNYALYPHMTVYDNLAFALKLRHTPKDEIDKCGLNTKLLGRKETAIFLKYSFSRNLDEREIKEIEDNRLIAWVKPKKVEFRANNYTVDGTQAAVKHLKD